MIKPSGLHSLQVNARQNTDKYKNVPKPYLQVAEGMESQFSNHLLSQLRKTIDKSEPTSNAERIYQSMLDDEYSKIMAKSDSGLGVKDVVLRQIYPSFERQNQVQGIRQYNQVNSHKGENHE